MRPIIDAGIPPFRRAEHRGFHAGNRRRAQLSGASRHSERQGESKMHTSITRTFVFVALISAARLGAQCVVTSLADSGPGSLREQFDKAGTNACPSGKITFAIKGTITLLSTILYNKYPSVWLE